MFVNLLSISTYGVEILKVSIEISIAKRGFPSFDIVGLPGKEISESKHRIITALKNSNISISQKKIVINLAPADIPKKGSYYDLPIAAGLASLLLDLPLPKNSLFFGELSLNGMTRYTSGAFLAALFAKENNIKELYVPSSCQKEVSFVNEISVYSVTSLQELILHLNRKQRITKNKFKLSLSQFNRVNHESSFSQVIGQEKAKRALEISAAGGHNVLLEGPPGAGKTMLAQAYRELLPPLSYNDMLDVIRTHSVKGLLTETTSLTSEPPFRDPHHTITYVGMVGGGSSPKPGEISLAHNGVLFMDEFLEFSKEVLEALRQPLEKHTITLTRGRGAVTFPSKFILLAASNPCPCGFSGHPRKECTCTSRQIYKYRKKLSGPIIDRIDLFVFVRPVKINKIDKNSELDFMKVEKK